MFVLFKILVTLLDFYDDIHLYIYISFIRLLRRLLNEALNLNVDIFIMLKMQFNFTTNNALLE